MYPVSLLFFLYFILKLIRLCFCDEEHESNHCKFCVAGKTMFINDVTCLQDYLKLYVIMSKVRFHPSSNGISRSQKLSTQTNLYNDRIMPHSSVDNVNGYGYYLMHACIQRQI